ncbi:hypothetical protein AXG93_2318s1110 [Marchantia polymorpha subsp. ruderalis]|uniref:C3H1-type domain-containing protein n=1 Tax=Marchantia polymorpha subsp. ruderalis TaxID=1480154 RepID=A0A176VN76_MARPO|nr:hypothetical protein AXG93_2318s1110 [Marchantia polymorpha subsp. ruderalis]
MEQDDEEFEQLLGEIPRATSAPPHLEELQRAYGAELNNSPFVASLREDNLSPPVKPFIDIRCDEQYENFYRNYSGVKKLPPPMENRNLGLALDSPRTMAGMRRQKQEPMANQMGASTNSSNNSGRTASPPSDHHHPPKSADERSISAAFGNLSFEESPSNGMMGGRLHEENKSAGPSPLEAPSNGGGYAGLEEFGGPANGLMAARLMNPGNGSDLYSGMEFNSNARALYSHRLHQQIDAEQRLRERQYQLQQHQQSMSHEQLWTVPGAGGGASVIGHSNGELGRASLNNSICRYYAQGYCSRGDACPFLHTQASQGFGSVRVTPGNTFKEAGREDRLISDNKMLPRRGASRAAAAPAISASALQRRKPESLPNGTTPHINGHAYVNGHHPSPISFHGDVQNHIHGEHNLEYEGPRHAIVGTPHLSQQNQQPKYNTLEEVEGRIFSIAKDQHGCRFLQRKFDEGGPEDVQKIFQEIIEHIIELMTDPFGNYLVQKLLEVCNEEQRMEILHVVTEKGELVQISLNMHGTRAVQKLIETLKSPEQVAMVIASLKQGVVTLIKDLNGNHVVQRCLQRLSTEDSQFIFDAAAVHCVEIATHRHGCCVLQRCVDFASGPQRQRLVTEIAANALVLSQDPFGNYVVQYILDLGMPWASVEVMVRLEGNYPYLAMQKFSSNVVEKCLKLAGDENRSRIVRELMGSPRLGQMLQDPYANYVVQSALTVAKGSLHTGLVEAIRPHLSVLRSSPYGKRILSRTNLKK